MSNSKDWYRRGNYYVINREYEKAIECYEKAVKIDPKDAFAWNSMGLAYNASKKYEKAIECFEKAVKIDPKDAFAWDYMGTSYDELKKYEKAIDCYEKAVKINPKYAFAWNNMGLAYNALKKYEKAFECYEKAVKIYPKCAPAWSNMGLAYDALKKYEKAIECYEKAVECYEKSLWIGHRCSFEWNNMGTSYDELKKYEKAIECYEKAIEIDPNYILAQNNLKKLKSKLIEKKPKEELDLETQEIIEKEEEPILIRTTEDIKARESFDKFGEIFVGCAGIWEVNTLNFKVKVQNSTKYSITDIKVILDKYPSMLQLEGNIIKTASKLGPKGEFWTPEFQLNAGEACVSGIIRAIVRYYDHEEQAHTIKVRPFEISYICPLLEAKNISKVDYLRKTRNMYSQEKQLIFEPVSDMTQFKEEMKEKMEGMNLSIISLERSLNEMVGYAEDKFHHDGLGLEAKIGSILDGQTEIILKAICEREDKCSPLLYKALQELSTLGLSVEKVNIMQKLDMFIDKPDDLTRYITHVIKSDWSEVKKDKWAEVIQEILEDWKEFKPKKWQKIAKLILKIVLGKFVGEELSGYLTIGIQNLFDWIKSSLS
jgi:tetratricopeptide (TPR) repeat protein